MTQCDNRESFHKWSWHYQPGMVSSAKIDWSSILRWCRSCNWDSDYAKYTTPLLLHSGILRISYSLSICSVGFGKTHFYVNGDDLCQCWLVRMFNSLKYVQEYYFIPPDIVDYDAPNLLVRVLQTHQRQL